MIPWFAEGGGGLSLLYSASTISTLSAHAVHESFSSRPTRPESSSAAEQRHELAGDGLPEHGIHQNGGGMDDTDADVEFRQC